MRTPNRLKYLMLFILLVIGVISVTLIILTEVGKTNIPEKLAVYANDNLYFHSSGDQETGKTWIRVARVIDGDTIELENREHVRYIGIDTPELSKNDCYAKEAYEKNRELVENKYVYLEADASDTDLFGRLLRYVYIRDAMVNELLVSGGYAYAHNFPPDDEYKDKFSFLEDIAKAQQLGLWKYCN